MLEQIIIGILSFLFIVVSILYLKTVFFEQEKRKLEETQHRKRIESLDKDFNQKKNELQVEYQKKEREFEGSLAKRREDLLNDFRLLMNQYNKSAEQQSEELNKLRIDQENRIRQEIVAFKSSLTESAKLEAEKEVEKIIQNKIERLNFLEAKFKDAETEITQKVENLKSLESAAIAARVREYEEKHKEDFYKIMLSAEDIQEINELESIAHKLRNPLPLRQAVYNIYYKDAVKDMTNRVCGPNRVSGIYKITHIESGQCYIGQSVDIANRWQQHCKRGAGADTPTGSKLYPEMIKYGIYSFKFEIIEQISEDKLSQREKYWGEYFGAKVFGYSIKN